ncbi:unnamed protein product, partial [Effrenium voratum]
MVEPEHHYFSIDVVKTTTVTSLGIDVDLTDGVTMMVKKVLSGGLVAGWNREHPERS